MLLSSCGGVPGRGGLDGPPPRGVRVDVARIPDAVPQPEPQCKGCLRPYTIEGQRFTPLQSAEGYVARGVASWYGTKFHGMSTATGERYDMYAMTAAHPTLPLPCYARVTNLANGHSVVVKINDRGPFRRDRLLDLSYVAAVKLDIVGQGSAPVEVRVLSPGMAPIPADTAQSSAWPGAAVGPQRSLVYVQAGAFAEPGNAQALAQRLRAAGVGPVDVRQGASSTLHRVRVGPVSSAAATTILSQLAQWGVPGQLSPE